MGEASVGLDLAAQPPAVILMAGLQGSGKTTTSGKLARLLIADRKKVAMVSADVYRPAAIEQLKTLATQVNAEFIESQSNEKPVDIARRAVEHARTHYHGCAHRRHRRAARDRRGDDGARSPRCTPRAKPVETLFVVDAMQGQDAVNVARAFNERLPLTGVILTKLDGDARGGAALSVRHVTGKPIKFAGVGEKLSGLEPFHPDRMAARILGMGDILSLVEEAHAKIDLEEAKRVADKVKKGKGFDLEDFKQQIAQMKKMGGVASLIDKLPAQLVGQINPAQLQDDKQFRRIEGIINSMTPQERAQAGAHQGLAQAPHRRRRRGAGPGGEPAPRPVRADAKDDEDDEGRQHAAHDAQHERIPPRHALSRARIAPWPVPPTARSSQPFCSSTSSATRRRASPTRCG